LKTIGPFSLGFLLLLGGLHVGAATIYSPPAYTSAEGDGDNGLPFNLANFSLPSARYQQVYGASQFSTLPPGGGMLTQIAFRIEGGISGSSFSTTLSDLQIDFSTTGASVDGLSLNFAANVGGDNTIVVHRGPLALSGTKSGVVSPFNVVITFDTPFYYNPAFGNLLMDVRNFGGGLTTQFDSSNNTDGTSRVTTYTGLDVNSPTGYVADTTALVTQFTFQPIPEPTTASLLVLGLAGVALLRRGRR
jgi:hypothetical protein